MDERKSIGLQKGSLSEQLQGRTLESSERGTEETNVITAELLFVRTFKSLSVSNLGFL